MSINIKKALVLGCSHASGNEISSAGIDDPDNSYPMYLARQLGYMPTNMAITGGSNDAMVRLGISHSAQYDIVIACWTGIDRTEVFDDQRWQPISAGGMPTTAEQYRQQWLLYQCAESGQVNKIKNILALNSIAKVINIDSFWPVQYQWPSNVYWPVQDNFWDWCCKQNYARTEFGHFGLDAHKDFARYLANNVKL